MSESTCQCSARLHGISQTRMIAAPAKEEDCSLLTKEKLGGVQQASRRLRGTNCGRLEEPAASC